MAREGVTRIDARVKNLIKRTSEKSSQIPNEYFKITKITNSQTPPLWYKL